MKKMKYLFLVLIIINLLVLSYFLLRPKHIGETEENGSSEQLYEVNAQWLTLEEPTQISSDLVVSEQIDANLIQITSEAVLPEEVSVPVPITQNENQTETVPNKEEEKIKLCITGIELSEKDFESIKNQLPTVAYQAKKIEKQNKKEPILVPTENILYWVHIPISGDIETQLADLKAKGFDTSVYGNKISIGLFRKANGALSIKEKAFNAGYTQVSITEKISTEEKSPPARSTITYQISFKPMTEKTAQKVETLLKKHAHPKAKKCS